MFTTQQFLDICDLIRETLQVKEDELTIEHDCTCVCLSYSLFLYHISMMIFLLCGVLVSSDIKCVSTSAPLCECHNRFKIPSYCERLRYL